MNVLFGYSEKTGNSDRFVQDMFLNAFAIADGGQEKAIFKEFFLTSKTFQYKVIKNYKPCFKFIFCPVEFQYCVIPSECNRRKQLLDLSCFIYQSIEIFCVIPFFMWLCAFDLQNSDYKKTLFNYDQHDKFGFLVFWVTLFYFMWYIYFCIFLVWKGHQVLKAKGYKGKKLLTMV